MRIFTVKFTGYFLTGVAIVFATDKTEVVNQLMRVLPGALRAEQRPAEWQITDVGRTTNDQIPGVIILFDGNY